VEGVVVVVVARWKASKTTPTGSRQRDVSICVAISLQGCCRKEVPVMALDEEGDPETLGEGAGGESSPMLEDP
jgi:hypothetical protein